MKKLFFSFLVLTFFLVGLFLYKSNKPYNFSYSLMSLPSSVISNQNSRSPAAASFSTKKQLNSFQLRRSEPKDTTSPPIISPDNPIQPRKSSAQSGDPGLLNLFNAFNLYKINQASIPEARCNDGTQPIYYLKKGFGAGANRWIIWLEGGGGCGSDDPNSPIWCGLRKNTPLSTSNGFPNVIGDMQGLLTKSDVYNPDFYSYNQISVHYCSSDFWGGIGEQKVIDQRTQEKMWFSGRKIIEALILDLKEKHNFSSASNVILSGSSAGGAGIVINADEIKKSLPQADIVTLVDAVNILPFYQYYRASIPEDQIEYIFQPEIFKTAYFFLPMKANTNCLNAQPKCPINARCARSDYMCFYPSVAARHIKTPTFIASDQLDNMILDMYGFNFCTERNPSEYSAWFNAFTDETIKAAQTVSGYFLPRTGDHGLAPTHHWTTPVVENGTNVRLKDVFGAWYFNRTNAPKRFIQSPSATLYPHQETNQGLCR